MVMRILVMLSALLWFIAPIKGLAAQPSLRLVVASPVVEYGQSIRLDLFADGLKQNLDTLNLSVLDQDFVVDTHNDVERDARSGKQHWRINLYPRHPGELLIPALRFHGQQTEPVKLNVRPAVDSRNAEPIQVSSKISNTRVWVNQAVRVIMRIDSDSQYAWLETETTQHNDLNIVKLAHVHASRIEHGAQRTLHRIGWVLYPQNAGNFSIQLPVVKYHHNGVVTHTFYPPKIKLHVRSLPEFVPPTMPIGKIKLDVTLPEHLFLVKRKLMFMTVRITSEQAPGLRPSSVLQQLTSNRDIAFYSPRDMVNNNEAENYVASVHTYQLPFRAKAIGLLKLPTVRLQYFDPVTGKINTHSQTLGSVLSVSQWMVYAGLIVLAIVLYKLVRVFYRWLGRQYQVYNAYRVALYRFQQADTPQAIREGIMIIASAEDWPTNLTLAEWLSRWLQLYPPMPNISESVHRLQGWLYGNRESTLDEIRSAFVHICYYRMPLLKFPVLARIGEQ